MRTGVEFRLLGPVEVSYGGRVLPAGSARERLVLANLLLNAGRTTATETLVAQLWGQPPRSAKAQLHNLVSALRRRFRAADPSLIETHPSGYVLRLDSHRLDLLEFRRLAEQGRTAADSGDHAAAAGVLGEALSLWRGPALADIPDELAGELRETLHRERLAAGEAKLDALLALGDHQQVLREVEPLLGEHPYQEGLYRRRMLALAGTGRRADALEVYRSAYRRFVDDLGVEPGPRLRELEQQILRGTPVAAAGESRLVPRQLPPVTPLTGRDELLKHVCGRARDGALVLLVGPGGIGKSATATAAGHRLAAGFPDGQLYADLRGSHAQPTDPYEVVGRFLRALGMAGNAVPADREERVAAYRARMAYQRILVVIDDAADEKQLAPLLPHSPRCATIATSRRQLATVDAWRFPVPALRHEQATRLLARIAGRHRVDAEAAAAAEIVTLCGALPLAVCVAAARLAVRPQWSLAEFARRLAAERGRLDELSVGDLDVRASIGLSYQALPDPGAALFRRLGLLGTPDWPAWVAELLAEDGAVAQLVDVHLVEVLGDDTAGQRRYRMHDLVAAYAAEQAQIHEPAAETLAPVLEGWLGLATEADRRLDHARPQADWLMAPEPPGQAAAVARDAPREWFDAERGSLLCAVDQACRLGLTEIAGPLALRLSGYLMLRGYDSDRQRSLGEAADCARTAGYDPLLVELLFALYQACAQGGDVTRLPQIATEEMAVANRLGDHETRLRALSHAANSAKQTGRLAEALELAVEGTRLARDSGASTERLANFLITQGTILGDLGDAAAGVRLIGESVQLQRRDGRSRQLALFLYSYGFSLIEAARFRDADAALREALDITEELGDELGTAHIGCALAMVDIHQGNLPEAEKRLDGALRVVEELHNRTGIAYALRIQGFLAEVRGALADAVPPLARSLRLWREAGSALEVAQGLARLERVTAALGDEATAAEYRREWRSILDELDLDEACLRLPPHLPDPAVPG